MSNTATSTLARRGRLRRSDCSSAGIDRRRRGRGFSYTGPAGRRLRDPETLLRIKELAIPPAWEDVWICPDPLGHLQATGVDAAGRKQYLYHPRWREAQDRKKFEHMVEFARALPSLRRRVLRALRTGDGADEKRVLACAIRLLDVGLFRVGSEEYADDEGGIGLATVPKDGVTVSASELVFDYRAKGGLRRVQAVQDPPVIDVITTLKRRRGGDQLLAYKERGRWHDVRSEQINEHLKDLIGDEYSAKDFRTWNATVLAAVSLAADGRAATSAAARKRAINGAVRGVSEVLGNTPAVSAALIYRPPRVRSLPLGMDDRRRARSDRRAARPRRPPAHAAGARGARSAG